MTLPTPLPPSDQCGDTATHPPHPHGSGRCYGLDGLEDLPRGPLVQQLRAAHAIVRHLCHFLDDYTSTDTSPMVEAHAEHMHRIAGHTADRGARPRPDRPVLGATRRPAMPDPIRTRLGALVRLYPYADEHVLGLSMRAPDTRGAEVVLDRDSMRELRDQLNALLTPEASDA